MPKSEHKTFIVEFHPSGRKCLVEPGATIMYAAQKADIHINNVCGGGGSCGKCAVIVTNGLTEMKPNGHLDQVKIDSGYVMACMTEIRSDITVKIPVDGLTDESPKIAIIGNIGSRKEAVTISIDPLCRKEYLELPKPSLVDNLADIDRIERELKPHVSFPLEHAKLPAIRALSGILRDSDFKVTVTLSYRNGAFEMSGFEAGDTSQSNYGVAVDLGTTTVMANLVDLNDGSVCGTAATYNSQMKYGDDVISRIVHTQENEDGLDVLTRLILADINGLIGKLATSRGISPEDVNSVVCTGNTIMIHILLGISPVAIRREPYIPAISRTPSISAKNAGITINENGYFNSLPCIGAYVGSDITAGVLASGMAEEEAITLFIDVGTNGEIVLGSKDWLICCSASAGPSFEGAGTRCGMRASTGAIEKVRIHGKESVTYETIGGKNARPLGICGSGYIDCIAELFSAGIIDRTGRFKTDTPNALLRDGDEGPEFIIAAEEMTADGNAIVIAESDIATLIRTKGAIYTAAEALIKHVGLDWAMIERIFISGGFGSYLDIRRSIIIGLLPDLDDSQFHFIGNGSLTGAQMSLLSVDALQKSDDIAAKMTYFDLSTDPWFMGEYSSSLFLPHTNMENFPSVAQMKL